MKKSIAPLMPHLCQPKKLYPSFLLFLVLVSLLSILRCVYLEISYTNSLGNATTSRSGESFFWVPGKSRDIAVPSNLPISIPLSHGQQTETSMNRSRAVFYNIYVPIGSRNNTFGALHDMTIDDFTITIPDYYQHAMNIVEEQIALKQRSTYLKSATIYYTLVGNISAAEHIQSICSHHSTSCEALRVVEQGDEVLTLQSLYEYCSTQPPDAQVTYIHNKGSFHPSERNEKFRAFLNKGVFSDQCQAMPHDSCNACASRFSTFPHYHMAGNMWTATCGYIQQLIPPCRFSSKVEDLFTWLLTRPPTSSSFLRAPSAADIPVPRPTFSQYKDGYPVGRGRFAAEHWLASHPFLRPCDVYARKYTHGYRDLPSLQNYWSPKLSTAPRYPIHTFLQISQLRGEWYCGQARLLEYAYLYGGQQPKRDHFVWRYYLEPFKGCDTPLNWNEHNDMFREAIPQSAFGTLVSGGESSTEQSRENNSSVPRT